MVKVNDENIKVTIGAYPHPTFAGVPDLALALPVV